MKSNLAFGLASIAVSIVVLAIKSWAYHVTGSVGLLSDALESIINVATALAAAAALWFAGQPADSNHPFGHHKAEYLSAVLEGVLIVLASLAILHEAYQAVVAPKPLDAPFVGLAISSIATLINAVWSAVLIRTGRARRSPALVADGRHLFADVVTSVGVVVGVFAAAVSGIGLLDPLVAALVALHILWSGWRVMKESFGGLMDEAVPQGDLARIQSIISCHADGAIEAHDLRTRQAGAVTFVEFHLVVAGDMTVARAHAICDRIEEALKSEIDGALITIHVEPEAKAKHAGIVVLTP